MSSISVVFIEARDNDVFYTGGLLPAAENVLPRDYDLDVIEAITRIRGPLVNGAFNVSNLSGAILAPDIGNPSPRLLRTLLLKNSAQSSFSPAPPDDEGKEGPAAAGPDCG